MKQLSLLVCLAVIPGVVRAAIATGIRYQKAIGQHLVFIADSESRGVSPGARVELLTKF